MIQQSPRLSVLDDATGIHLSWPGDSLGWGLYIATNLGGSAVWTLVTNQTVLLSGQWQVTLPRAGDAVRFYRLQQ